MKGVIQFGKKSKLGLRYVSPFEVKEVVGTVAYRVALAPELIQFGKKGKLGLR